MNVKEEGEKAGLKLNIKKKKKKKLRSWNQVPSFHGKEMGVKVETVEKKNFSGAPK